MRALRLTDGREEWLVVSGKVEEQCKQAVQFTGFTSDAMRSVPRAAPIGVLLPIVRHFTATLQRHCGWSRRGPHSTTTPTLAPGRVTAVECGASHNYSPWVNVD